MKSLLVFTAITAGVAADDQHSLPFDPTGYLRGKGETKSLLAPNKCTDYYASIEESLQNGRLFKLSTAVIGEPECADVDVGGISFSLCVGDQYIVKPTPLYSDVDLETQVGSFDSINTIMAVEPENFVSNTGGTIIFDDGSELLYQDQAEVGSLDYFAAVTGGTGKYAGVQGQVEATTIDNDGTAEQNFKVCLK